MNYKIIMRDKKGRFLKGSKYGKGHKKGVPHSESTKLNISKALKGKPTNRVPKSAFKKGQSAWNKGTKTGIVPKTAFKKGAVPHNKGVLCNYETKQKISLSKNGGVAWNKNTKGIMKPNKTSFTRERLIGNNNYNWKGGITALEMQIRGSFKYIEWRKEIFERDNYTCQKCKTYSGVLNAHHINYFSVILKNNNIKTIEDALLCNELWDLNNGITLCKICHKKIHLRSEKE